jgi:hypothetical protein
MPSRQLAIVLLAGVGSAALSGGPALAQNRDVQRQIEELRRLIERQQETIGELQRRLEELQGEQAQTKARVEEGAEQTRRNVVDRPLVNSGSPRVKVAITGQISRLLNLADDGKSTKAYFVDNNISVSRLRVTGTADVSDRFSIGTNIELAISPNNSAEVSQINEEGSQRDEFRKTEGIFKHADYGTVSFGKGDPATKDISRIDLSGTDVLAMAGTGEIAGGLLFRDDDEDLTGTTVNSVFTDFDSGRQNRVRYDTPTLAGFTGAASYGSDQRWGAAVRWAGTGYGLKAAAGLGVQDPSTEDVDQVYAGSATALHEATGLNFTLASAWRDQDDGTGRAYYVKGGWQHAFFTFGATAFSIDYGLYEDTPGDGDDGTTIGLVALQNITDYGTELFAGFRLYDLDPGDGPSTETIYVGTAGTRIKF